MRPVGFPPPRRRETRLGRGALHADDAAMPTVTSRLIALAVFAATLATSSIAAADPALPGSTQLISRPSGFGALDASTDGWSGGAGDANAVSGTGRYALFASAAPDLSPDGLQHAIVRDNLTGAITIADRVGTAGALADQYVRQAAISSDGSTVCFQSPAGNLVAGVGPGVDHIYVKTLATGALVVADRATGGALGNGTQGSRDCALDADGGRVAFSSWSTNLVPGDSNGYGDVFERNLTAATTTAVDTYNGTLGDAGASNPDVNGDGSIVAFRSYSTNLLGAGGDTNGHSDIFTRAIGPSNPVLISRADGAAGAQANADSYGSSISDDGQKVAFETNATNLADGDSDTVDDVHVRDVAAGTTTLVSRADGPAGAKGDNESTAVAISGDGSTVAFASFATTLGAVSPGPFEDGDPAPLVFVRKLGPKTTVVASRATGAAGAIDNGGAYSPSLTTNGNGVVFTSGASNLDPLASGRFGELFQRDLGTATTILVSRPADAAGRPGTVGVAWHGRRAISADGRYVVFVSSSDLGLAPTGLAGGDYAYVRDTLTGATTLVSRSGGADGAPAVVDDSPAISADGTRVAFASSSPALGGDNRHDEVYVRDLQTFTTTLASVTTGGQPAPDGAYDPALDQDGGRVVFRTWDPLVAGDGNAKVDAYVRDLSAGTTILASVASGGASGDGNVQQAVDISGDGTRVAFTDDSDNLVPGDANNAADVFVRDLAAGTTTLADALPGGQSPKSGANEPSISLDGTRVAFQAFNLGMPADTGEIYVRDLQTGALTLASVAPDGTPSSQQAFVSDISADGNHVTFFTTAANLPGAPGALYERNLSSGTTEIVGSADGSSAPLHGAETPVPSGDGSCVVFSDNEPGVAAQMFGGVQFSQVYLRTVHRECPLIGPDTTITAGPAATIHTATTTLAFTATYAGAHFECSLDGGAFSGCASGVSTPTLRDGVHRFAVRAVDAGGEVDQTPALSTFTVAVAPVLSHVSVSHASFRLAVARTAVVAKAKAKTTTGGTMFRWTLSKAATVRIAIAQRFPGRRSAKRCAIPSRKLHTHAACTRLLARVGLARHARAGRGSLQFSGRWGKRHLAPGSYQATLTAKDMAGNASRALTIRFRVIR
jgi:WD40-like Beta Propeller Repeat